MDQLTLYDQAKELAVNSGLPTERVDAIISLLLPVFDKIKNLDQVSQNILNEKIVDENVMKNARVARIEVKSLEITVEKIRKKNKSFYFKAGKAIDGMSNIIKLSMEGMQEKLLYIEKTKERRDAEILKKALIDLRETRHLVLNKATENYDISNIEKEESYGEIPLYHPDFKLEEMTEADFRQLVEKEVEIHEVIKTERKEAEKREQEREKEEARLKAEEDARKKAEEDAREKQRLKNIELEKENARLREREIEKERENQRLRAVQLQTEMENQRLRDVEIEKEKENERTRKAAIEKEKESENQISVKEKPEIYPSLTKLCPMILSGKLIAAGKYDENAGDKSGDNYYHISLPNGYLHIRLHIEKKEIQP